MCFSLFVCLFLSSGRRSASTDHQPSQSSLSVGHRGLERHSFVDWELWEEEWHRPQLRTPQRVHNIQVRGDVKQQLKCVDPSVSSSFILKTEAARLTEMLVLLGPKCFKDEQEDVVLCPPGGDITLKAEKHAEGKINNTHDTTAVATVIWRHFLNLMLHQIMRAELHDKTVALPQ